MRVKIHLETAKDATEFANKMSRIDGRATIIDGEGHCVNAKSILGALYALEFNELWFESDKDLYSEIDKFIVI